MDPLGKVMRELLKQAHVESVRQARTLALGLRDDGMTYDQIEEMLYSSEFDHEVIAEVMQKLPSKKAK